MKATVAGFICVLTLTLVNHSQCWPYWTGSRPTVDVPQGRILGVAETEGLHPLLSFRSIPFAMPPKKELRFKAPIPADPWTGDLDASKNPSQCPQLTALGREDCLYLNVYTPLDVVNGTDDGELLPVMVFIHGGAYYLGGAVMYDHPITLVRFDVVVVLIQYRLGVLGFFSTDDDVAPGNQGLMDQTLGLKWVNENIAAFGGDPSRITLFGESAGSSSTHYQMLTPSAAGLFQQAILQSGNGFCSWAVGRDFYNVSRAIARRFDCPEEPSEDLVSCLQGVSYLQLSNMYSSFIEWNFQPFKFAPRVDGTYIPDEPARLVRDGRFNKVPTIMGATRNEGSLVSGEMYGIPAILETLLSDFPKNGPISLELYDDENPVDTATQAYNFYLGDLDITEEDASQLTKLYTDRLFHVNVDWLAQEQASQTDVYLYEFDYVGQHSIIDLFVRLGLNLSESENWICHGDDLIYTFDLFSLNANDSDIQFLYTNLFANFAIYGTPTPTTDLLGFLWTKADPATLEHLSISTTPVMVPDSRQDVRAFWESLPLRINNILH